MLLTQAIDKFKIYMENLERSKTTIFKYIDDLHYFRKFLQEKHNGQVYLEDIKIEDIEDFMALLKEKDYSCYSKSRYYYTIRSFYNFAYKKELVNRNIAVSVDFMKMPKKERQYLTEIESNDLIAAIKPIMVKLAAAFLLNTSLRISECLNLTLTDVDFDRKTIHVRMGKGKKDRIVPINHKLYPLLLDYKDNWRDAPASSKFFATKKTSALSGVYINRVLADTAKEIGLNKKVSCHILRHSFASTLVKKNVGLVQIQRLLGHSNLAVTSVYTHTNLEQLEDAVNCL